MALSDEDKQEYVKQGGVKCPYCESRDIENYDRNSDIGWVADSVQCNNCSKSWEEIYNLADIKEDEDSPEYSFPHPKAKESGNEDD
jgi:hypothetical protein